MKVLRTGVVGPLGELLRVELGEDEKCRACGARLRLVPAGEACSPDCREYLRAQANLTELEDQLDRFAGRMRVKFKEGSWAQGFKGFSSHILGIDLAARPLKGLSILHHAPGFAPEPSPEEGADVTMGVWAETFLAAPADKSSGTDDPGGEGTPPTGRS